MYLGALWSEPFKLEKAEDKGVQLRHKTLGRLLRVWVDMNSLGPVVLCIMRPMAFNSTLLTVYNTTQHNTIWACQIYRKQLLQEKVSMAASKSKYKATNKDIIFPPGMLCCVVLCLISYACRSYPSR